MQQSYGKCKAEFAAARLDKYQKYLVSPTVLPEERLRYFRTSLESHESAPLFSVVMQAKNCEPLLALSPSVSSMSSAVVMTSSDMVSSTSLTTPQLITITPSISLEEGVE